MTVIFHLVEYIVEAVRILQEKRIVALVQTKPVKAESAKAFMFVVLKKKGLEFCYQCKSYPCARYIKFADTWQKYGQNLLENQEFIKNNGKEDFLRKMK